MNEQRKDEIVKSFICGNLSWVRDEVMKRDKKEIVFFLNFAFRKLEDNDFVRLLACLTKVY